MVYLELGWLAAKWICTIWVLSYFIRWFLPDQVQRILRRVDDFVLENLVATPVLLSNIWFFTAAILYFIGNFFVLVLLALGAFMVGYSVYLQWGQIQPTSDALYQVAKILVEEKAAWSGATLLIAATVAVGHMWKLNLDRKQYFEKKEEEMLTKIEKKRAEEAERMKRILGHA